MLAISKVLTMNSLIWSAFAAGAAMYSQLECTLESRGAVCTTLLPNSCCIEPGALWMSAQVYGIWPGVDTAWLGLNPNDDGHSCVGFVSGENLACLQTGAQNILGVFWFDGFAIRSGNATFSTTPAPCKFHQVPDVYWFALPGKQRKPYSMNVTYEFERFDAVDMQTHSFKLDKLDIIQEILSEHGNGLTEIQLAALSM